jgi:C1A family cysteine protease
MMMNKKMFLPIEQLSFCSLNVTSIKSLKQQGIATFAHLNELLERHPNKMKEFNINELGKLRQECKQFLKKNFGSGSGYSRAPIVLPPMGMILDPKESDIIMQRRQDTKQERLELAQLAQSLTSQLPDEFLLNQYMQAVRNQGSLGSCTGFGSVNAREYLLQMALSPGFAYMGAKMLDGYPQLEGSWQEFAFEFMYRHGCVLESEYSYDKCLNKESLSPYLDMAEPFKIASYVDLMVEPEYLPIVLKAALSGFLMPELGPQPVSISVAVYESFCDRSAYTTGLIPVPMDSEERQGGHAMCVCGYTTIYDVNYFLVINSWGEEFAKENPLGLPGYALIPESYIAKPGLVGELLLPIDT